MNLFLLHGFSGIHISRLDDLLLLEVNIFGAQIVRHKFFDCDLSPGLRQKARQSKTLFLTIFDSRSSTVKCVLLPTQCGTVYINLETD